MYNAYEDDFYLKHWTTIQRVNIETQISFYTNKIFKNN